MKAVFQLEARKSQPMGQLSRLIEIVGPLWGTAVILWAVDIYALTYFFLSGRVSPELSVYVIQPLLWLSLGLISFLGWRYGLKTRPRLNKKPVIIALLIGVIQVTAFFGAGLVFGFGRSPYGHQPLVLVGNLAYVGAILVGMEMSRAYLVVAFGQRRPMLALLLVCLFFSFLMIPYGGLGGFESPMDTIQVAGGKYLPTISENLLATLLALIGGPIPAMIYLGLLKAFEWIPPILPDLDWIIVAFLGTLVPILGVWVIQNVFLANPGAKEGNRSWRGELSNAWILVGILAVTLIWLNTGVFGVRPTVIISGSMAPTLQVGDVAITQEVPPESIQVGDIIHYRQESPAIIHRVVAIQQDENGITFITRGDENDVLDPPVPGADLNGKVVLAIPKIGWLVIGVRGIIGWMI